MRLSTESGHKTVPRAAYAQGATLRASVGLKALVFTFIALTPFALSAATTELNVPRRGHSATELADGRVLIVGGRNVDGEVAEAEIYDPDTDAWTTEAAMAHPRPGRRAGSPLRQQSDPCPRWPRRNRSTAQPCAG